MTRRRGTRTVLLGLAVSTALVAAACGGSESSSTGGSGPSAAQLKHATSLVEASTAIPEFVAPGPKFDPSKARGKTVYAIPVSASVPFNVYVGKYLTQALGKFDIKTVYYSTTGQSSQWVSGMNTAISHHAAAIALIGLDPAALQPQIKAAKAAGIPVIVDHFLDTSHTDYAGYKNVDGIVGAPYKLAGQLEAAYAIKETKGKGTFLLVQSPDLLSSTDVAEGIQAEFAKDCPSCHVVKVDVPFNDWSSRMQTAVSSALTRYPDAKYVLPVFDGMVQYVIPAITAAGKTRSVSVATYNATPFALNYLAKNKIVAMDLGESFSWLGYALADQTLRLIVGEQPVADEKVPVRVFTSDNVSEAGDPPAINTGYGNAYEAGYEALWGLS